MVLVLSIRKSGGTLPLAVKEASSANKEPVPAEEALLGLPQSPQKPRF